MVHPRGDRRDAALELARRNSCPQYTSFPEPASTHATACDVLLDTRTRDFNCDPFVGKA
jgi:hypothetical protein